MAGRRADITQAAFAFCLQQVLPASRRGVTIRFGFRMSEHKATISWKRTSPDFLKGRYSREHAWTFDGGLTVPASPAPSSVPAPYSNPSNVDPEEAFVAAVSSCHMLTFLFVAYKHGFQVDSYHDEAVGVMTKNDKGVPWVSSITLTPQIAFSGEKLPTPADEGHLHHLAHEQCFIANSIKTEVRVGGGKDGHTHT
jgi:organic hydroperoxide reductase OsmC/OhrA